MKSNYVTVYLLVVLWLILGAVNIDAQTNTIISLQSTSTALETGTYYPLTVYLQDVSEVWQINAEIEYDPTMIYVVGAISGQPAQAGDFFGDNPNIVIRNYVDDENIIYTHSLVAPADPLSGSGIVATYQIYPLSAGTTQIRFTAADLTKVTFSQGADGNRDVETTEDLPVLPALIEFTITGETVSAPDESTPTPEPSATVNVLDRGENNTPEPTLENIVLQPTLIPELVDQGNGGIPLALPIGLLLVGVIGILGLFITRRR